MLDLRYGVNTPFILPMIPSQSLAMMLWILGVLGAHRFYYGKPVSGTLWCFSLGLLGIGWLFDAFLIRWMDRQADRRRGDLPKALLLVRVAC